MRNKMKQLNFSLVILLFIGITFAQAQVISQTEEFDITQIEEKAKANAKSDFNTLRKFGWGGSSCITLWGFMLIYEGVIPVFYLPAETPWIEIGLLAPFVPACFFPVNIPEYREKELLSVSSEYQRKVYRAQYLRQTKIQRMKYLLVGEVPTLLSLFFVLSLGSLTATCFAEGTEITMADGSLKSIEDIQVGDKVLSYNLETRETEADEVLELYSPTNNNMMRMEFSDGTVIHSTFDHPYYVKNKGWCSLKPEVTNDLIKNITDVGQLQEGDVCHLLKDGQLSEVEFVDSERIPILSADVYDKEAQEEQHLFC